MRCSSVRSRASAEVKRHEDVADDLPPVVDARRQGEPVGPEHDTHAHPRYAGLIFGSKRFGGLLACRRGPGWAERECLVAGGGDPGELAEIADQMGLVGVSGVGCDLSPVQRAALVDVPPYPVEADQPGRGLSECLINGWAGPGGRP